MSPAQGGVSDQPDLLVPTLVYPHAIGIVWGALGELAMVVAFCYGVLTSHLWLLPTMPSRLPLSGRSQSARFCGSSPA